MNLGFKPPTLNSEIPAFRLLLLQNPTVQAPGPRSSGAQAVGGDEWSSPEPLPRTHQVRQVQLAQPKAGGTFILFPPFLLPLLAVA